MVSRKEIGSIFLTCFLFTGCTQNLNTTSERNIETGYYYLRAKEYSLALKYFLQAKRKENDFRTNFLIAYTLYKQKNYKDALKFIDEALKFDKKNSKALILKGDIYLDLGNYELALYYYKKVLENKDYPNYYLAYYKIGKVFLKLKNLEKAKNYFLRSYYNNPYFVEAQKELVKIYIKEGNLKKAKEFLKNLLTLVPNDKEVIKLKTTIENLQNEKEDNFIVF